MTSGCNPDLFDGLDQERRMTGDGGPQSCPILAIPCGFHDRRNMQCRRLGVRPVTIDGQRFYHRGYAIVHCDSACFRGAAE